MLTKAASKGWLWTYYGR